MINGQVMVTCFYYPNLKIKQTSKCYLGAFAAWSMGQRPCGSGCGGAGELPVIGELPRPGYAAWPAACWAVSPYPSFTAPMDPSSEPRDSSV